jgi:hypothetical protein
MAPSEASLITDRQPTGDHPGRRSEPMSKKKDRKENKSDSRAKKPRRMSESEMKAVKGGVDPRDKRYYASEEAYWGVD